MRGDVVKHGDTCTTVGQKIWGQDRDGDMYHLTCKKILMPSKMTTYINKSKGEKISDNLEY